MKRRSTLLNLSGPNKIHTPRYLDQLRMVATGAVSKVEFHLDTSGDALEMVRRSFQRGLHSSLYFSLIRAWHQSTSIFRSEHTSILHTGHHIGTKETTRLKYSKPPTNAQCLFLVMYTDTFTG